MKSNQNTKLKQKMLLAILIVMLTISILRISENILDKGLYNNSVENKVKSDPKRSTENGGGYIMNTDASYNWIEIASPVNNLTQISEEQDASQTISLPWNFTFYGMDYDEVHVSSNGYMSFSGYGDVSQPCGEIPSAEENHDDIAALFATDLNLEDKYAGGDVFYKSFTSPNQFIIEYKDVYNYETLEKVGSFEAIFYESGIIKFQYDLENLDECSYDIGLDHGDFTNYNSFNDWDPSDVPITSKAIEFTFDQMLPVDYDMNLGSGEEYSWIITEINKEKMVQMFGDLWSEKLGLFANPQRGTKTKINVTSIVENSTHWNVHYDIWNFTSRIKNFSETFDGDANLSYNYDPFNYEESYNLTNIVPFILPSPSSVYLKYTNLSDYYILDIDDMGVEFEFSFSKSIAGDTIYFDLEAFYTSNGILDEYQIYWENDTSNEDEKIFEFKTLIPDYLTNFSLGVKLGDKYSWIITHLNADKLNNTFGENWAQDFGLFSNPSRGDKTQIEITSIGDNSTHWEINYDAWNWTGRLESFSNPDGSDNLIYRQEPFNYSLKINILKNIYPFILPYPSDLYLEFIYGIEDSFYYYEEHEELIPLEFEIENGNLDISGTAEYTSEGLLEEYQIMWKNYSSHEEETILKIVTYSSQYDYFSLELQEAENYYWITTEINNTLMEAFFGSNWEQDLSLPENPKRLHKTKMEIVSISESSSDWDIDYDLWDWTSRQETYTGTPQTSSLNYKKDPFNYSEPHELNNLFPLFIPSSPQIYLDICYLNESVYDYMSYNTHTNIITTVYTEEFGYFHATANYNQQGILQELIVDKKYYGANAWKTEVAFQMLNFYEGSKPSYIAAKEGENYEYEYEYSNEEQAPSGYYPGTEDAMKFNVTFIGGNDPSKDCALVITSVSFKVESIWRKPKISYRYAYDGGTSSEFLEYLPVLIVAKNIDWDDFVEELSQEFTVLDSEFSSLENGFHITVYTSSYSMGFTFIYTAEGVLDTEYRFFNKYEVLRIELINGSVEEEEDENDEVQNEAELSEIPGYNLFYLLGFISLISFIKYRKRPK